MSYFKVVYKNNGISYCMAENIDDVRKKYSEFPVIKIEEVK